jgi:catechol 2,3-dioxygenase-like lactoylglutathione lyase family enzyme
MGIYKILLLFFIFGQKGIVGIDHVPIVVNNPDSAAAFYKNIGFAIKPGRFHENGIRNQHVKFPDGTELELITASAPVDVLTTEYCNFLREGEGPAYFGLYTPAPATVMRVLDGYMDYEQEAGMITFPAGSIFHPLFFGGRNISPTDKPAHFAHTNTAHAVSAVWLATNHIDQYLALFQRLGIPVMQKTVLGSKAQVGVLAEGEVILLPASFQVVPRHEVIGVTVRVSDIKAAKKALQAAGIKGLVIPPSMTHGIWLAFSS